MAGSLARGGRRTDPFTWPGSLRRLLIEEAKGSTRDIARRVEYYNNETCKSLRWREKKNVAVIGQASAYILAGRYLLVHGMVDEMVEPQYCVVEVPTGLLYGRDVPTV